MWPQKEKGGSCFSAPRHSGLFNCSQSRNRCYSFAVRKGSTVAFPDTLEQSELVAPPAQPHQFCVADAGPVPRLSRPTLPVLSRLLRCATVLSELLATIA